MVSLALLACIQQRLHLPEFSYTFLPFQSLP